MVAVLYNETPKHKANFTKLVAEHFYDSLLFHRVIAGFMIQGGDPDSKRAKAGQALGSGGPGYTVEAEFVPTRFHKKGALAAARLSDAQNPTKASSGSQFYIVQGKQLTADEADELKYDQSKLNQALQQYLAKPEHALLRDSLTQLYSTGDLLRFKKKVFALAPALEKETGFIIIKEIPEERIKAYTTLGGTPRLDGNYTVFGELIAGQEVLDKIAAVKKDGNDRPAENVRMFISMKELSKKKIAKLYGYHFPSLQK
ncbi:MAG: peptidylprolyl isomerase [Bacteroidetes bacterium]|nr:peptidylprolyl isomerase [Bacteroidota bacterium]